MKTHQIEDTTHDRPEWVGNFTAKTLYEAKERQDLSKYSPGRLRTNKVR